MFARAGIAVLAKIRSSEFDTISKRPVVTAADHAALLARVLARRLARAPLAASEAHNAHV